MSKTWFITGASRGFGRAFATAALERGDRVAATARNLVTLDDLAAKYTTDLLPIRLDVTDRGAATEAVQRAQAEFRRLDVVVNNAGYGHFGMVEELSEEELREQLETNLFGAVWVTQAAIPIMRAQGSGHIVQVSTIGGVAAFTNLGAYHASKWALEGISESLSLEVAAFGIKVTLIEPGGFATDWAGASARRSRALPEYDGVRAGAAARRSAQPPGNPDAAAEALLEIVDTDEPHCGCFSGLPHRTSSTASTSGGSRNGNSGSAWRTKHRDDPARAGSRSTTCRWRSRVVAGHIRLSPRSWGGLGHRKNEEFG